MQSGDTKDQPKPGVPDDWFSAGNLPSSNDSPWFHDIFRRDGTPYDAAEVEYTRRVTGAAQRR